MGFYNPITYFIKSFIRLFTRKFFWVILILICVFLGFVIFSADVKAIDNTYNFNYNDFFSSSDIERVSTVLGSNIYNNEDYDIFLVYVASWGNNFNGGKNIVYVDTSSLDDSTKYKYIGMSDTYTNFNGTYYKANIYITSDEPNSYTDYSIGLYDTSRYYTNTRTNVTNQWFNNTYNPTSNEKNTYLLPIRTHFDIVNSNDDVIFSATNPRITPPYFITTDTELEQFDFDYLQINGGTTLNSYYFEPLDVVYNADYLLQYRYKGVVTEIDVRPYLTVNNDETWQINIPYNVLTNYVVVRNGEDFSYRFRYTLQYQTGYDMLKEGTYDLTSQQQQDINEDSDKYVQGEILDQQKETNQKLDDLNNSITNDDVDDVSSEFGDFSNDFGAEDNTGIEQIFQKLYDAFCSDEIQDVVITIPFVNKSFTISTDTISSNFPQSIKSIVGVFVWGVIGLWVLKDIRSSINKIAEGSPEDVGSDVKKEVL